MSTYIEVICRSSALRELYFSRKAFDLICKCVVRSTDDDSVENKRSKELLGMNWAANVSNQPT